MKKLLLSILSFFILGIYSVNAFDVVNSPTDQQKNYVNKFLYDRTTPGGCGNLTNQFNYYYSWSFIFSYQQCNIPFTEEYAQQPGHVFINPKFNTWSFWYWNNLEIVNFNPYAINGVQHYDSIILDKSNLNYYRINAPYFLANQNYLFTFAWDNTYQIWQVKTDWTDVGHYEWATFISQVPLQTSTLINGFVLPKKWSPFTFFPGWWTGVYSGHPTFWYTGVNGKIQYWASDNQEVWEVNINAIISPTFYTLASPLSFLYGEQLIGDNRYSRVNAEWYIESFTTTRWSWTIIKQFTYFENPNLYFYRNDNTLMKWDTNCIDPWYDSCNFDTNSAKYLCGNDTWGINPDNIECTAPVTIIEWGGTTVDPTWVSQNQTAPAEYVDNIDKNGNSITSSVNCLFNNPWSDAFDKPLKFCRLDDFKGLTNIYNEFCENTNSYAYANFVMNDWKPFIKAMVCATGNNESLITNVRFNGYEVQPFKTYESINVFKTNIWSWQSVLYTKWILQKYNPMYPRSLYLIPNDLLISTYPEISPYEVPIRWAITNRFKTTNNKTYNFYFDENYLQCVFNSPATCELDYHSNLNPLNFSNNYLNYPLDQYSYIKNYSNEIYNTGAENLNIDDIVNAWNAPTWLEYIAPTNWITTAQSSEAIFDCPEYQTWLDFPACVITVVKNAFWLVKTSIDYATSEEWPTGMLKTIWEGTGSQNFGTVSATWENIADTTFRNAWNSAFDTNNKISWFWQFAFWGAVMLMLLFIIGAIILVSSKK